MTRAPGYMLRVEPGDVDLERFDALVATARAATAAGDPARASTALSEALALWRGAPLADLADEPFARDAVPPLEERRVAALEDRFDADLALGRHAALVPELEAAVRDEPLRERLRGQLMLALYRCGRQGDALRAYTDARRTLVEQLGLEPGPALRGLEQRILAQDPGLDPPPVPETPASKPAPAGAHGSPIRRRRLLAAGVVGVVGVLAIGAAVLWTGSDDERDAGARPEETAAAAPSQPSQAPAAATVAPAVAPAPDSIARVDPATGGVEAVFAVGTRPTTIAAGEGAVWVLNAADGTISRLDPATGATRTFAVGAHPADLAVGAGAVWIVDADYATVRRVDPSSLLADDPIPLDDGAPVRPGAGVTTGGASLVATDAAVWVVGSSGHVLEIDPAAGRVRRSLPTRLVNTIAFGGGALWATTLDGAVVRIDPDSGRATARVALPGAVAAGVAYADGAAWVTDPVAGAVWRADPSSRPPSLRMVATRPGGVGIAAASGAVWISSGLDGTLSRVEGADADAARTIELGHEALHVTSGGDGLWVALGSAIAPLATSAGDLEPVGAPPCGRLDYRGPGRPDVLVVVDAPLQGVSRRQARTIADVAGTVLRARGFRAGAWRVGLQVCDDSTAQSDGWEAERCAANMRAYAANRAVVGVIGPYNSGCAVIAVPAASTAPGGPLATVSPSNNFVGLTAPAPTAPGELERLYPDGRRGYVRVYPTDLALGDASVRVALDGGARRAAILEDRAAGGYAIELAEAYAGAARRAGLEVVVRAGWRPGAASYAALGARLARRGVDVVFVAGLRQDDGLRLLTDLHAAAPSTQVVAPDQFAAADELVEVLGVRRAPWLHVVSPGLPADRIARSWRALLETIDGDAYWPPYAAAATVALLDAIARSDGTRADVAARLRTTSLPDGPFGAIAFNRSGDVAAPPFTVLRLAPGGTGMHPDRPDFADGLEVERVID